MAEERTLPGWPKKKLVREVRRHLSHYGIRPVKSEIWQATWAWANVIAHSYFHTHWPLPSEIGSQYILLSAEMHNSHALRSSFFPPTVPLSTGRLRIEDCVPHRILLKWILFPSAEYGALHGLKRVFRESL
jgi:hypothetical protein